MSPRDDVRAVSNVIGAVFIFGTLIILLAVYQAQVVPNQNRAAEFEHSNAVQNDMVDLRNAILTAKTAGRTTFSEVKLGTRYPDRILAVNPPPAAGSLRTGPARPITVDATGSTTNLCPGDGTVNSRILRYQPGYNVYQNGPEVVYENTVLYLDFGDRQITLTDEQLVRDEGDIVEIVPLNTSLSEQGINAVSVEPEPGNVRERELTDANISLPTNLSEDKWEELLADDLPASNVTVSNGNLTLETGGEVSISCSPVGLNEAPAGGSRTAGGVDINPAGPNDVELRGATKDKPEVTAELVNTAQRDTNITSVRMPFVFVGQSNVDGTDIDPYDVINENTSSTVKSGLEIAGPLATLDTPITLPGNDTRTDVSFRFDNANQQQLNDGGFLVVTAEFENGAQGTYFIEIPS